MSNAYPAECMSKGKGVWQRARTSGWVAGHTHRHVAMCEGAEPQKRSTPGQGPGQWAGSPGSDSGQRPMDIGENKRIVNSG